MQLKVTIRDMYNLNTILTRIPKSFFTKLIAIKMAAELETLPKIVLSRDLISITTTKAQHRLLAALSLATFHPKDTPKDCLRIAKTTEPWIVLLKCRLVIT